MGPRSDERGNAEAVFYAVKAADALQWGRARMSAEMRKQCFTRLRPQTRFNGAALG